MDFGHRILGSEVPLVDPCSSSRVLAVIADVPLDDEEPRPDDNDNLTEGALLVADRTAAT